MSWKVVRGGSVISYGFEQSGLGFYCTITTRREYDGLRKGYDGLPGLLRFLIAAGVVTEEDVAEAVRLLPEIQSVTEIRDPAVRFAAGVIVNLQQAAAN